MDIVLDTSKLIWPVFLLVLIIVLAFIFKKPITSFILTIRDIKFEYRSFKAYFSRKLADIKAKPAAKNLPSIDEHEINITNITPEQAILNAWDSLNITIYEKLKKLFPSGSVQYERLTLDRAYNELLLTGVMTPGDIEILKRLNELRIQMMYRTKNTIALNDALDYISLVKRIQKKIDSLTELPSIKLTPFTLIISEINHLIDTGKYNNISLNDVKREIKKGTILKYLQETANNDVDFSIILNGTTYPGFENYYIEHLQSICDAYSGNERRKWGVVNIGLCLLLAWTNEIVQQGSGWHPSD